MKLFCAAGNAIMEAHSSRLKTDQQRSFG